MGSVSAAPASLIPLIPSSGVVSLGTRRTYAIVALDGGFRNGPAGSSDNRQMGGEERDEGTLEGLLLHYRVPDYLQGHIEPGHIVTVPLRGRPAYGVVTGLSDEA